MHLGLIALGIPSRAVAKSEAIYGFVKAASKGCIIKHSGGIVPNLEAHAVGEGNRRAVLNKKRGIVVQNNVAIRRAR